MICPNTVLAYIQFSILGCFAILYFLLFFVGLVLDSSEKDSYGYKEPFTKYWDYIFFTYYLGLKLGNWAKTNGPKRK